MKLPQHIYHLAEAANWPAIQRDGLRPASQLLTDAGLRGAARDGLERAHRAAHTVLPSGVEIRDQRPMPSAALERCLHDMRPADWYRTINARVFFWLDADRLNRQRAACGSRPQVVLVVDTARLIAAHGSRVALTPINTGNARRQPARRGVATFVSLADWLERGWASESSALGTSPRPRSHRPVELTVLGAVPDVMQFVLTTIPLPAGESFSPLDVTDARAAAGHHA